MSTKKDLETARAAYNTSLRQLAGAALAVVEKGPTIFDDALDAALRRADNCRADFLHAHNVDRAADLAQLPKAE